jgi:hypothetical protein
MRQIEDLTVSSGVKIENFDSIRGRGNVTYEKLCFSCQRNRWFRGPKHCSKSTILAQAKTEFLHALRLKAPKTSGF